MLKFMEEPDMIMKLSNKFQSFFFNGSRNNWMIYGKKSKWYIDTKVIFSSILMDLAEKCYEMVI